MYRCEFVAWHLGRIGIGTEPVKEFYRWLPEHCFRYGRWEAGKLFITFGWGGGKFETSYTMREVGWKDRKSGGFQSVYGKGAEECWLTTAS